MVSDILPDIVYDILQAGLLPPLDKEAAGIITGSEAILKEFASKHSLNASTINSFIKDVLKNPAFNADEVDTNMLQRLQASALISRKGSRFDLFTVSQCIYHTRYRV